MTGDTVPIVGTQVLGNYIGVDASGTNPLPNGTAGGTNIGGISILGTVVGVTGTVIGGSGPGAANIISYNDGPGIAIEGAKATGNTVQGNSIYANTKLGIDLGADGVTPNHAGFLAGPNNFQNYPVLIGAVPGSSTEIVGTFNSLPNAMYTLDFYDSSSPDPTGFGQGKTYLGSATVTTDSSGNVRFDVSVLGSSNVGDSITATATDSAGNTSEFSRFVVAGLLVTNTNDSGSGSLRQAILNADASSITLPKTIGFNIPGGGVQTIAPVSALPTITTPVIVDGYTQPGASANTLSAGDNAVLQIVLNGAGVAATGVAGLYITSSNTTVEGLVVNGFNNSNDLGILISGAGATGNVVSGDFIGTNAAGTAAVANAAGVAIESGAQYNTVGGTSAGAANVISGNTLGGVGFVFAGTSYNVIEGNLIGLNAAGIAAIGNGLTGAYAIDGASNDTIGGTTPARAM